ncbi:DNA-binding protein [Microbacterium sp. MYb62]|uniref:YobI family P-loop NTPase n=1 Tax=Microbacterium sp. MYb62 TaxID=1848690 RepID=UPI000CFD2B37|nr:DNA-binding protein [Microbacterium sp. MYb62]PRB09577.1 DNA-binding protein [Microbacterium sp. MYb62]
MTKEPDPAEDGWNLEPLTAGYLPDAHAGYVDALKLALKDDQVLNIALSGNYGVGKSSILRGLAEAKELEGRVVELSLSTLAPIETSKLDDSIPKQATTPTNRIQQEIVKQLLYREVPGRMPGSRFERIERFKWKRELGAAGLAGFVVSVVFLLTGWSAQIASVFKPLLDVGLWIHLIILIAAAAAVFGFRWLSYGRIHIKQFSAGAATVTLDDKSVSYFDQYLDEIVHFFEVSKKQDVVIFEDIDRFNNSHIFETLRSLNTLLNGAPQIKKKIRFIYAIKDSIFDKIGLEEQGRKLDQSIVDADDPALAETIRANRTKFFDLVIPVVPFITHRSARNLATQLLGRLEHTVKPELLDLAAQYVPDMRLLINVRNEFIVFRDRIFSGDGAQLDLDETALFAMMLYKSTHLSDFEAIRIGKSKLDALYAVGRDLIGANIERIETERRGLQRRLARVDGAVARSDLLGRRLIAHAKRTARSAGAPQQANGTFTFGGASRSEVDLTGAEFWREFASADDGNASLHWSGTYNYNRYSLTFSRKDLAVSLGYPINAEAWDEAAREELREEIAEKSEAIKFLRSADMGALIQSPDYLVDFENVSQSLDTVTRTLLTPGLAYQLVRAGFIDRDFTLYTSTFHGDRVSTASTNFIIHHVERDAMDVQFELTPDDVDMVVRERGRAALRESALYNIAILDRLLDSDPSAADIMIHSLVSLGDTQKQFLQAYLDSGSRRKQLVERLTPMSSRALTYLVSEAEMDDALRLELVDATLATLTVDTKYRADEATSAYLLEHYTEFPTVFAEETTAAQATQIAELFKATGVVVPTLAPSRANLRRALVERNLYQISLANLMTAMGRGIDLGLDSLSEGNQTVYYYCLDNLSTYLEAIDESEGACRTIDGIRLFTGVLIDVLEHADEKHLDRVVAGAAEACVVDELDEAVPAAWPALAKHQRFSMTFKNVTLYLESVGTVDDNLAPLLANAGAISDVDAAEEHAKEALAKTVLSANAALPSADLRAQLVEGLSLTNYLDVDDIPAEKGDLFACLRRRNVIADDAASYERLAATDWPTREAFIDVSVKFPTYVAPEHVGSDLASLLLSTRISDIVKQAVLDRADEFAAGAGTAGLRQLAGFAIQKKKPLSEALVLTMAQGGVPAQSVVVLLGAHLATIATAELFSILQSLSGYYPKLTSVGYDKPRIPNTSADRALLDRLKRDGIVNSYDPAVSPIKVNKKLK